jgi:hypothetical protein
MKPTTFIKTAKKSVSYDEDAKKRFHRQSEKILLEIASLLGYKECDYDLRHNQGGIAVSGEITLHSDNLYVQFAQSCVSQGFMWRTCKGRKDYCGGTNHWMRWDDLVDLPNVAATFRNALRVK